MDSSHSNSDLPTTLLLSLLALALNAPPAIMSCEFPLMPRDDVEKLLNHYPLSEDLKEQLEARNKWHKHRVRIETESRVQARLHDQSKMVQWHQAWVDMHKTHVRLLKAIIAGDTDTLSKWDEARRAENEVEAVCKACYQARFPMEMTKALNEAHLRRAEKNLAHAQAEVEYYKIRLDWAQTQEAEAQDKLEQARFLASV